MLDDIFTESPDPTFAQDRTGAYRYVSQAGGAVFGLTPETMLGKTWRELGLPAETMEPLDAQCERVVATRRPLSASLHVPTTAGIRVWEYTLSPLCAAGGSVDLVIARLQDMSDRPRAEPASAPAHLASPELPGCNSDEFAWTADIQDDGDRMHWDLRMDEAAAQRVFPLDLESDQPYASAWYWSRVEEDRLRADAHGAREIRAGRSYSQQFRCRGRDGNVRWFAEEVRLEAIGPGHWRAAGLCRDITDRQHQTARTDSHEERVWQEQAARAAAEQRFHEAQEEGRRKDEFLAMLAHELRNPLAPILNAVQVMRLRGQADPPHERARDVVERQVRHMARLLDDLLDVSRITRGLIELRMEPVDLAATVENALQTSRPFVEAKRHEVSISLPPEPLWVEADATRLEQVVVNLINNAAKYTDPEGAITISLTRESDEAALCVRDSGVGLSPELLPTIFDLFTQADRSLDRAQGGLGIGLTLVRRLVELHGGQVSASSPGPGHGSEFVVRLPIAEPGSRAADQGRDADTPEATEHRPTLTSPCRSVLDPGSAIPNQTTTGARRVLIVEDHTDAAQTLADLLELWGHEVRVALDGPMAIEAAAEFLPDVVLIDIGLPGMDGYEVARRLRREPVHSRTRLLALTGYGKVEDRRRSREAGFQWHLTKPVNPGELERLLARPEPESA
jgi:two-component system CheB/CheR fusion protein